MNLSNEEYLKIIQISNDLGINHNDLIKLISFESGFNPQAKNPLSSAKGLIQFIDETARELGFENSEHLITQHPTVLSQLDVVYEYLVRYYPFKNKQELYMSVFLPSYRKLNPNTVLPNRIRLVNPGITTIQDYINLVERKGVSGTNIFIILSIVGIGIFIVLKGRKYVGNRAKRK
jgi:hypothetical protein